MSADNYYNEQLSLAIAKQINAEREYFDALRGGDSERIASAEEKRKQAQFTVLTLIKMAWDEGYRLHKPEVMTFDDIERKLSSAMAIARRLEGK